MGSYLGTQNNRNREDTELGCVSCMNDGLGVFDPLSVGTAVTGILKKVKLGNLFGSHNKRKWAGWRDDHQKKLTGLGYKSSSHANYKKENWAVGDAMFELHNKFGNDWRNFWNKNADSSEFTMAKLERIANAFAAQMSAPASVPGISTPQTPSAPTSPVRTAPTYSQPSQGPAQKAGFGANIPLPIMIGGGLAFVGGVAWLALKD